MILFRFLSWFPILIFIFSLHTWDPESQLICSVSENRVVQILQMYNFVNKEHKIILVLLMLSGLKIHKVYFSIRNDDNLEPFVKEDSFVERNCLYLARAPIINWWDFGCNPTSSHWWKSPVSSAQQCPPQIPQGRQQGIFGCLLWDFELIPCLHPCRGKSFPVNLHFSVSLHEKQGKVLLCAKPPPEQTNAVAKLGWGGLERVELHVIMFIFKSRYFPHIFTRLWKCAYFTFLSSTHVIAICES